MLVACTYKPGRNWISGKSIHEQRLGNHIKYMLMLNNLGKVAIAGPLMDNSGGLNVFHVESLEEAEQIMYHDPAITEGICVGEAHPWYSLLNSWTGENLVSGQ
jgi:uncharacterized protein YciI